MTNLPYSILQFFTNFLPLFSQPSYRTFLLLFQAHVLSKGRRTIADLLRRINLKEIKNYSKYHTFFSKAKWSPLKGAEILLLKLIQCVPGKIIVSIDSTVERRKGVKIKGLGIQRDAVRSTKNRKVLVPGLHWLVCAIHIKLPWCQQPWALPFFTILMPPENPLSSSKNEKDLKKKTKHKTLNDWACQVAILLRRWVGKSKDITIVADSAFATYILANKCKDLRINLVSRMRLDARTFEFPEEVKGKKGRKRLVGKRLPTFNQMLNDPSSEWKTVIVSWYNGSRKKLEILKGTCLWYGYGIRPVPISWVLIRDPDGNNSPTVLFSTEIEQDALETIEVFVGRWQIEVTFEEARRHLGMETQRQWSDKAIDRVTPCIFASYSMINLIALECLEKDGDKIHVQTTSWYNKNHITFSDVLASLRSKILREQYYLGVDQKPEMWIKNLEEYIYHMSAA